MAADADALGGGTLDVADGALAQIHASLPKAVTIATVNAHVFDVTLPEPNGDTDQAYWTVALTTHDDPAHCEDRIEQGETITVPGRTVLVLRGIEG